jgi:RNA recognition motif-containing protein
VGNLSFSATDQDVRAAFEAFGQVSQVNIIVDRETGRSRGFAFVEMPNAAQAQQAIEKLNQSDIGGRSVVVNEARPKTDRGGGGGGGGRGGGYGGGGGRGGRR